MLDSPDRIFVHAQSFDEALVAIGDGARVLAGGTWLMRDPLRGVATPPALVSLAAIPAFTDIEISAEWIAFGAGVTHACLAATLQGIGGFEGLAAAAKGAANPAIRRVATLGGNLCTLDFAAADLVPALLALDADVEIATVGGRQIMALETFLKDRATLLPGAILLRVIVSKAVAQSAHARLLLRKAGDYPVAIVSVVRGTDGDIRVAVGSVETVARRWLSLEAAFAAQATMPNRDGAAALAKECNDFSGRDGLDAEGWYRCEVLPALVRRAFQSLVTQGVAA